MEHCSTEELCSWLVKELGDNPATQRVGAFWRRQRVSGASFVRGAPAEDWVPLLPDVELLMRIKRGIEGLLEMSDPVEGLLEMAAGGVASSESPRLRRCSGASEEEADAHWMLFQESRYPAVAEGDDFQPPAYQMCKKCLATLPLTKDFFYPHKNRKTGFQAECIQCQKKYARKRSVSQRRSAPDKRGRRKRREIEGENGELDDGGPAAALAEGGIKSEGEDGVPRAGPVDDQKEEVDTEARKGSKKCARCWAWFPATNKFFNKGACVNGLHSFCRPCHREATRLSSLRR